jgi:hypothetical protein
MPRRLRYPDLHLVQQVNLQLVQMPKPAPRRLLEQPPGPRRPHPPSSALDKSQLALLPVQPWAVHHRPSAKYDHPQQLLNSMFHLAPLLP